MAMSSPRSSPHRRGPARVLALVIAAAGLLPWIAPRGQTADPAPPAAGPEQTLRDYYEAISSGACDLVTALRPGYGGRGCRDGLVADLRQVETLRLKNGRAAMFISVELRKKEGIALFSGFVGLRQCAGRWIIMTNSFKPLDDREVGQRARYVDDLVHGRLDNLENCRTPEPVQVQSGAGPSSSTVSGAPVGGSTTLHGSDRLLRRCWTDKDLAAQPGEDEIRPADDRQDAQAPILDESSSDRMRAVSQPPYNSIRRVRLYDGRKPAVALSFNLIERPGEVSGYDGALVDVLRRTGTPATFFASGRWMRSHPERVQQLLADPLFELGSLGWDHRNLAVADADEIERQLLWTEATYRDLLGQLAARPCAAAAGVQQEVALIPPLPPLVRFPYGRCDEQALKTVGALGTRAVQWSLVMDDIALDSSARSILERVRAEIDRGGPGSGSGAILVGHADGRARGTATTLPEIIAELHRRGYELVTVSELLARGSPMLAPTCYEHLPDDNLTYDTQFPD